MTEAVKAVIHKATIIAVRDGAYEACTFLRGQAQAGGIEGLTEAHAITLTARIVGKTDPTSALNLLSPLLSEVEPLTEALLLAAFQFDKLGLRSRAHAVVKCVVEDQKASPIQVLLAANLLVRFGDQELALQKAARAYEEMGRPIQHAEKMLYIAKTTAAWHLVENLTNKLREAHTRGQTEAVNESPRTHLLWCDDEALNLKVLDSWSRRNLAAPSQSDPKPRLLMKRRLRVGYLSSDLREHPLARLMQGIFRDHDHEEFELFMYCCGWDDGSELRRDVESHFDHVHSVSNLSDIEAANLIRSHQIDVLVDLNGPTRAHRMGILSHRPAPVQIDYLGFPGSVGGRVVDYIIGDHHTVPEGVECDYPEKVIRLFPSYYPNDHANTALAPQPSRRQVGLPDDPNIKIIGMFNAINKVNQQVWDTWMRVLKAVPDTVLWILDPGLTARKAIARATHAAGVPVSRVMAAPHLPQAKHLARIQCCDLMLDPWPYGGHTSTVDALYAGVPVVAMEGKNFASRVSPSLLRIAGLETLVCKTSDAYVRRAVTLLEDPAALAELKVYLLSEARKGPLFRSQSMARQLERAYRIALSRAIDGLPPDHITLSPTILDEVRDTQSPNFSLIRSPNRVSSENTGDQNSIPRFNRQSSNEIKSCDRKIPLVLVLGPWGSGTSAVAGMLAHAGLQAPGPYVNVNDPNTPHTFEMQVFQQTLRGLASEKTLQKTVDKKSVLTAIKKFRDDALEPLLEQHESSTPVMLKHALAALFLDELSILFDLKVVGVLREHDLIEATRLRRGWPDSFGSKGAEVIERNIFNFIAKSDTPFHVVRHKVLLDQTQAELKKLLHFCKVSPGDEKEKSAIQFVRRQRETNASRITVIGRRERTSADVTLHVLKAAPDVEDDEATVFAVLKNEIYFLPFFLEHYRKLGVKRFVFLDDRSFDGSKEYLLQQSDCGVLQADVTADELVDGKPFLTRAKQIVPERYFLGRWVATLDCDEFLMLPTKFSSLSDFCQNLDVAGLNHCRALMLDFFPSRLSDLEHASRTLSPMSLSSFFDVFQIIDWPDGWSAPRHMSLEDGVRSRMVKRLQSMGLGREIWEDGYKFASLNKIPIVKWIEGVESISAHRFNFPVSNENQVVLKHFKFFPGWDEKLEDHIRKSGRWNNAIEYRFLRCARQNLFHWDLRVERSHEYVSAHQLERLGLLFFRASGGRIV